jgi:RHS repeat-associated protein
VAGGPGPDDPPKHPVGAGPSHLGAGGYNYDSRSTLMTTAAICATREVSWSPSFYRGEQYDSDLALYYLRARYYNPTTGRFLSRDPEDGKPIDPKTLHKYLYAGGDPVNATDSSGKSIVETVRNFIIQEKATIIYAATCGWVIRMAFDVLAEEEEGKATPLDIHGAESGLTLCVIGGIYGLLGAA